MSRLVLGTVAAVLVGVGVAAQQEMLPRPGPGSGVTPVSQRGPWDVAINNTPTVRVENAIAVKAPPFATNGDFEVTWPNGDKELLTFIVSAAAARGKLDRPETSGEGWIEVRNAKGGRRWINLANARSVEKR